MVLFSLINLKRFSGAIYPYKYHLSAISGTPNLNPQRTFFLK